MQPRYWTAAMKAMVFTGWIYDHLRPHAAALKVAHPLMLRTIAAAKKKNASGFRLRLVFPSIFVVDRIL